MAEVVETVLPGVGVRHEFTTASGERVAVLVHRTGRREIAVYDRGDPDVCTTVIHLSSEDSRTLVELLGADTVTEAIAALPQRITGLAIDWITVPAGSAIVGTTIAEGSLRTRTGASIVAIIRDSATMPAPEPSHRFEAGDVAVSVGTAEGLTQLRQLLSS